MGATPIALLNSSFESSAPTIEPPRMIARSFKSCLVFSCFFSTDYKTPCCVGVPRRGAASAAPPADRKEGYMYGKWNQAAAFFSLALK